MSTQLYGQFDYGSLSVVSRALAHTLKRHAIDATIYAHGALSPRYIDVPFSVAMNSLADVGIFVGYAHDALGWLEGHSKKVLVTVCEASPVPREWIQSASKVDLVVVPSDFCKTAFVSSGLRTPIMVCPHGVSRDCLGAPSMGLCYSRTKLLHVTEAGSFPWRKGTAQLIQAFRRVQDRFTRAELYVKSKSLQLDKVLHPGDRIYQIPTLASSMGELYQGFDAVVQPSRGEGFGMVPLEARCMGIPVALTATSGHLQHLVPDVDVVIPVGPATQADTQGNSVGLLPTVSVDAVEEALVKLLGDLVGHRRRTVDWARDNANKWLWPKMFGQLAAWVRRNGGESREYALDEETGVRGF